MRAKNDRNDDGPDDLENGNVTSYSNNAVADQLRQRKSEIVDNNATKF